MYILYRSPRTLDADFPCLGSAQVQGDAGCVRHMTQFHQQAVSVLPVVGLVLGFPEAAVVLQRNDAGPARTNGCQVVATGQFLPFRQGQDIHPKK